LFRLKVSFQRIAAIKQSPNCIPCHGSSSSQSVCFPKKAPTESSAPLIEIGDRFITQNESRRPPKETIMYFNNDMLVRAKHNLRLEELNRDFETRFSLSVYSQKTNFYDRLLLRLGEYLVAFGTHLKDRVRSKSAGLGSITGLAGDVGMNAHKST
jgi:hypothetical protein